MIDRESLASGIRGKKGRQKERERSETIEENLAREIGTGNYGRKKEHDANIESR